MTTRQAGPDDGQADSATAGDDVLVHQAREGSRLAFEALVKRYQRPVYFLCQRYVRDHDTAADLAQRAFIKAFERLGELRQVEIFQGWLFRIAANLSLNHLRDHARFVDEATGLEERTVPAEAPVAMEAREDAEALRAAVATLPTKQRMTLELRVYEEMSFKDIADALGTTEGAAKVNFHYAVRKLRDRLGDASAGKAGAR